MSESSQNDPNQNKNEQPPQIVQQDDAPSMERRVSEHWGAGFQCLTPRMRGVPGGLNVNRMTLAPHSAAVPFHHHRREHEVFVIQEGRGVFRYGDEPLREVSQGDCISCPAGTGTAHQLANPFDEPLIYLAIGCFDEDEICGYPDTGKVLVRGLGVGRLEPTEYMDGESERPKLLDEWDQQKQ